MKTIDRSAVPAECAEIARRLREQSLAAALDAARPVIQQGVRGNFTAAVGSSGAGWPPRKDHLPHPLLNQTGALLAAASGQGAGSIVVVQDRALSLGVDKSVDQGGIPGAAVHNFGYPDAHIPQREYLYCSEATADQAVEVFADRATELIFNF